MTTKPQPAIEALESRTLFSVIVPIDPATPPDGFDEGSLPRLSPITATPPATPPPTSASKVGTSIGGSETVDSPDRKSEANPAGSGMPLPNVPFNEPAPDIQYEATSNGGSTGGYDSNDINNDTRDLVVMVAASGGSLLILGVCFLVRSRRA